MQGIRARRCLLVPVVPGVVGENLEQDVLDPAFPDMDKHVGRLAWDPIARRRQ